MLTAPLNSFHRLEKRLRKKLQALVPGDVQSMSRAEKDCLRFLAKYGEEKFASRIVVKTMTLNECHRNALELYHSDDSFYLMTGFAYSERNKLWYRHSWCYNAEDDFMQETTVLAQRYWGVLVPPRLVRSKETM